MTDTLLEEFKKEFEGKGVDFYIKFIESKLDKIKDIQTILILYNTPKMSERMISTIKELHSLLSQYITIIVEIHRMRQMISKISLLNEDSYLIDALNWDVVRKYDASAIMKNAETLKEFLINFYELDGNKKFEEVNAIFEIFCLGNVSLMKVINSSFKRNPAKYTPVTIEEEKEK